MPSIIVIRGQQPGRILPLREDAVLGRGSRADLQLPDPSLSRQHCHIFYRQNHWHCEDLNSTNGVYVNGQHVQEAQPLKSGDLLTLGHVQLLFSDAPCQPEPVEPAEKLHPPAATPQHTKVLAEIATLLDGLPQTPQPQPANFQLLIPLLASLAQPLQRLVLIGHNPQGQRLHVLAQGGESPLQAKLDTALLQFALKHPNSLISLAASSDPRLPVRNAAEKLGLHSLICVPVQQGEMLLGLLMADSTEAVPANEAEHCHDALQLLARLLAPKLTPAASLEPQEAPDSGLKAWQKQLLASQPPFLPGLQWLQSHQHEALLSTALHYTSPTPHEHYLLAMDAQGQHHLRLRNLLLDELCIWLDATLAQPANFNTVAEALTHRCLGLPANIRWCLLQVNRQQRSLRWHNHQLHCLRLENQRIHPLPDQGQQSLDAGGPSFILGNQAMLENLPWQQWPDLAPALLSRADAALEEARNKESPAERFVVIIQANPTFQE